MAAFFLIDMHQNLEKPPESLGIEMEPDDNGTSDFRQRYVDCSRISDWATVHIKVEVNMCSEEAYTEYCD